MSVEASISFEINEFLKLEEFLPKIQESDWDIFDHGKITFLDIDDFEWKSAELNELESVLSQLIKCAELNQPVGLVLSIDQELGITLLFMDNSLSISLNINRKTIDGKTTDFSYYLSKLNFIIEKSIGFVCEEIY